MFKATLFIDDKEYPLLDFNYSLSQKADHTGHFITLTLESKVNNKSIHQ